MNAEKHAEAIFRDFEKLYRLSGIYGDNPQQIRQQMGFIDNNLENHLVGEFGRGGSVRFDILMSSVFFKGEEVFRSKTPEFTLSYALFYEGIKSIIFKGGLTAQELFEWIQAVKSVLKESDDEEGSDQDLASVLWRQSSPNIKVSLYNLFADYVDVDSETQLRSLNIEDSDEFEEAFLKEVLEGEFKDTDEKPGLEKGWQTDPQWELPSGDHIIDRLRSVGDYNEKIADRLKRELSDAAVSDRAKKIVRFSPVEIDALRREIETYDENQVQFNVMVHYLSLLESEQKHRESTVSFISESVRNIVRGVIKRFHAGLLLFTLKRFRKWKKSEALMSRLESIEPEIKKSLGDESNLEILAEAFGNPARIKIAKELIPFLEPRFYQFTFNHAVSRKDVTAQKNILQSFIDVGAPLDQLAINWGEKELLAALPVLAEFDWEGRNQFLIRCLRSRSPKVSEATTEYLPRMEVNPGEAAQIYGRMRPIGRKKFLTALARSATRTSWKDFITQAIRKGVWQKADDESMALWINLGFKYMGQAVASVFEPFIFSRKFVLWPKFKNEREAILNVALQSKEPAAQSLIRSWAQSEKGVIFQNSELKSRLSARAG